MTRPLLLLEVSHHCPPFPLLFLGFWSGSSFPAPTLQVPTLVSWLAIFFLLELLLGLFSRTLVLRLRPAGEPYQTPFAYSFPVKYAHADFLLWCSAYIFKCPFTSSLPPFLTADEFLGPGLKILMTCGHPSDTNILSRGGFSQSLFFSFLGLDFPSWASAYHEYLTISPLDPMTAQNLSEKETGLN